MDWLMNILRYANNGAAPQPQQPGQPLNILPQAAGGTADVPQTGGGLGLWKGPGQGQQGNVGQNFALNQAMGLLRPPQMQPTQWMPWMR